MTDIRFKWVQLYIALEAQGSSDHPKEIVDFYERHHAVYVGLDQAANADVLRFENDADAVLFVLKYS